MNEQEIEKKLDSENVRLSSINKRSFAYFIDEIVITILFAIIFFDQVSQITSNEQMVAYTKTLLPYVLVVKFFYQVIFIYMYGATLGKLALKIKVVETEYFGLPTLQQAVLRSIMRIVSEMLFYIGFVMAFFSPIRLTWQDRLASTLVVDV